MPDVSRISCTQCGTMILPSTAAATGGVCMPCKKSGPLPDEVRQTLLPKRNDNSTDSPRLFPDSIAFDTRGFFTDVNLAAGQKVMPLWFPRDTDPPILLAVSVLGDFFVQNDKAVWGVCSGRGGTWKPAAASVDDFKAGKFYCSFTDHFVPAALIQSLISIHGQPPRSQCFSPVTFFEAGGKLDDPANYCLRDFRHHLIIAGILHALRESLPDKASFDWRTASMERARLAHILAAHVPAFVE